MELDLNQDNFKHFKRMDFLKLATQNDETPALNDKF